LPSTYPPQKNQKHGFRKAHFGAILLSDMSGVTIKHYRTIIAHPKTNIGPEKIYDENSKKGTLFWNAK
jgi:hypothetical protein